MSSGLRPAASRPSIAQLVIEGLEPLPALLPQPPSLFWTETSQSAAPAVPVAAFAWTGAKLGEQQRRQHRPDQRRRAGAPLEPLAEPDQHPQHRRAGDQREDDVADRVREVERDRARLERE